MSPALAVVDLRFAYRRGGDDLYAGLSHTFAPNAVTAVTGESGRGKSTLLYLMGLLLRPSAGRVLLDGAAVQHLPDIARSALRARRMGFVFQDAVLDPSRTVLDAVMEPAIYVGAPRAVAVARATALLAEFGVQARADYRPGEISGGQAQRVALCRALLNNPDIILADEPTGNLDRGTGAQVLDALRRCASGGRTVVIATHDPVVVGQADHELHLR